MISVINIAHMVLLKERKNAVSMAGRDVGDIVHIVIYQMIYQKGLSYELVVYYRFIVANKAESYTPVTEKDIVDITKMLLKKDGF